MKKELKNLQKTLIPNTMIVLKYPAAESPITYKVLDVLKIKKAEKLYSEKIGYSFFDNVNKELIKKEKSKKVVILEDKNNVISYDYLEDFLNNTIKYKIL